MKFVSDSEHVYHHATLGHRPDTKPFECDDNALDSTARKSENNMMMDHQSGVLCASEANERDADGCNVKKLDRSMSLNDLTNNNERDARDLTEPYSHSCRKKESFEESSFYMDKNIMECELPELIVCCKESTYHVKDICVDEGVHSQDKIMFESDVSPPPVKDTNSELTEERNKNDKPLPDVMKSSAENASNMENICECDSSPENVPDKGVDRFAASKDFMLTGEVKDDAIDKIANTVSTKLSIADLLSKRDLVSENSCLQSLTIDGIKVEKGSFECISGNPAVSGNPALISTPGESNDYTEEAIAASSDFVSAAAESKCGSEEAVLANPALVHGAEAKKNDSKEDTLASPDIVSVSEESTKTSNVEKLSYNGNVETGSITFNFDDSAPTAKGTTEDCPRHGESAPIESPDRSKLEDAPRKSVSSLAHGVESAPIESPDRSKLEDAPRKSVSSLAHGVESAPIESPDWSKLEDDPRKSVSSLAQGIESPPIESPDRSKLEDDPRQSVSSQAHGVESAPIESPDRSKLEDAPRQSVSSLAHGGLGESSFSVSGSLPGLISYSGQVAFSGNLSIRSDSSTTSTRSFAFPVLQSDWNSSPVRMAKADRRRLRKQKCWKQGLLCCRF